jgi:hypothetical protein
LSVVESSLNPLNAELNPICHLLALLGAHHILYVSRIKVNIQMGKNACYNGENIFSITAQELKDNHHPE